MAATSWRLACVGALVLICLANSASANSHVDIDTWKQCGGKGGDCNTMPGYECKNATYPGYSCKPGCMCQYVNEWYWQCIEGPAPVTPPANNNTTTPPTNNTTPDVKEIDNWKQCGGKGGDCGKPGYECKNATFTGGKCKKGFSCQYVNEWHWQCNEGPATPVTPPANNTNTTTPGNNTSTPPTNNTTPDVKEIDNWKQCGGKGGDCGKPGYECKNATFTGGKCKKGFSCQYVNEWHWQCNEGPATPVTPPANNTNTTTPGNNTTTPPTNNTTPDVKEIDNWKQCGGKGGDCGKPGYECKNATFTGGKCKKGFSCQYVNEWHWQCNEGPATPVTPPANNTNTTTPGNNTSTPPTNNTTPDVKEIDNWKQCGGKGGDCGKPGYECKNATFTGGKCKKGFSCQYVNEWHWQCNEGPATPVTPPANNTNTTTPGNNTTTPPTNNTTPDVKEIDNWKQCGGMGGDCGCGKPGYACKNTTYTGYKCKKGYSCQYVNQWYWQCVEGSAPTKPTDPETPPKPEGPRVIEGWAQCGGEGGDCTKPGNKCVDDKWAGCSCAKGFSCNRQDHWYWQCKP